MGNAEMMGATSLEALKLLHAISRIGKMNTVETKIQRTARNFNKSPSMLPQPSYKEGKTNRNENRPISEAFIIVFAFDLFNRID